MNMDIGKKKDFCGKEYYYVDISIDNFKELVNPSSLIEKLAFEFLESYDYIQYLHFDKKYNKNNLSLCRSYNELEVSFDGIFSGLMEMNDYDMIMFLEEISSKINCSDDLSFMGFKKCCFAIIDAMKDMQDKIMPIIKKELDKYIEERC